MEFMDTAAATYHIHFKYFSSKISQNIFHRDVHAQLQSSIGRTVTIISLMCIYKCQHAPIQVSFLMTYFLHHMNLSSINSTVILILLTSCCIKTIQGIYDQRCSERSESNNMHMRFILYIL